MAPTSDQRVIIIGAGLAGSLMACYLARAGWTVRVYERRPDPRAKGYLGGRSINLALSVRGLWGLAGVGLDRHVLDHDAIRMPGRMIHPIKGEPIFQPYSSNPADAINSVSRGGLNLTLINAAAAIPGVEFFFDHTCVDVDLNAPAAILQTPGGGTTRVEAELLLGADGAFSPVRGAMQKTDRFEHAQSYLGHGYKELHIPEGTDGRRDGGTKGGAAFAMDPHALHIWPRGGAMMIALPNRGGSFTCTLFWPFTGEHSFEALEGPIDRRVASPSPADRERVLSFFREQYPDAVPLMPTLAEDFVRNPTSSLVTIRCFPWRHEDKVVLLGDAAHAIVPFYGQGMNAAFEDCRILADLLADGRDRHAALVEFERRRKPDADAIADMAIENFIEMRDKTGQPEFRYKKRGEQAVHAAFGAAAEPQYNLVSFSTVPYAEARRRGRALDAVLEQVIARVPMDRAASMTDESWRNEVTRAAGVLSGWSADAPDAEAESSKPRIQPQQPFVIAEASSKTPQPRRPGTRDPGPRTQDSERRTQTIFDITPPVTARLAVWPGDTPLSREVLCDIEKGANITLSSLRATVHLGAHADGPNHYGKGAPGIGERPLHHYLGPCRVVDAPVDRASRVRPGDIVGGLDQITEPRVLIRTGTFPDPEKWNSDFAGLSVELIESLASRGVVTIGLDTPSVDLQDSRDLPAHHAMLRHDMAILEGLVLADVPPGPYELIALPLKLMGFDASPIRAILRPRASP
ncbi:MAG: FAD-dependent monooxygenase [Phycisphaerales bacterium]